MKRHQRHIAVPTIAGIAAAFATAATLWVTVSVPATYAPPEESTMLAMRSRDAIEVTFDPIQVIGVREKRIASTDITTPAPEVATPGVTRTN